VVRDIALVAALGAVAVANTAATTAVGGVSVLTPLLAATALLTGRASRAERAGAACLAAVTLGGLAATALTRGDVWDALADAVVLVLFGVLPWLTGRYLRQRADLLRAGWRWADLVERERAAYAAQERLRERARIAEDMHDSLGHELSLIAIRAGALEVAPNLDEAAFRSAAGELRAGATTAIERLQEIIGVLHDPDAADPRTAGSDPGAAETAPGAVGSALDATESDPDATGSAPRAVGSAPGAAGPGREPGGGGAMSGDAVSGGAGLAGLVAHARAAGLAVDLRTDTADRPAATADLVHRVVREGLTNAAKHAPGAAVRVDVAASRPPGATEVRVRNSAPDTPPSAAPPAGGRGLAALGRRVRRAGGRIDAGPDGDGGFLLTAHLPHDRSAEPPDPAPATEAQRRLTASRRRVNRGLAATVLVPAVLLVPLVAGWYGFYAYVSERAVLPPDRFDRLEVGQDAAEAEALLPPMEMLDPPAERGPVPPEGADCRHYRPRSGAPGSIEAAYRVCFADGRLVAKETVPTGTEEAP
jgi:signal transduction histidine kinase